MDFFTGKTTLYKLATDPMQHNTSFDKQNLKVLLLEGVHPIAEAIFRKDGYNDVTYHKTALSQEELLSSIGDYHFVGIRSRSQLNHKVLERANKLVAVGCFCIGTNQVDLDAAQSKGIPVRRIPTLVVLQSWFWAK